MSDVSRSRRTAAAVFALITALLAAETWLSARAGDLGAETLANLVAGIAFPVLGLLIARRRPTHPVGWLLLAFGFLWGVAGLLSNWSEHLTATGGRDHGALAVLATLAFASVSVPLVFILLLFPTGRLLSPRWRWLLPAAVAASIAGVLAVVLTPTVSPQGSDLALRNPFAAWSGAAGVKRVADLVMLLHLPVVVGIIAQLIVRFRRSTGVERLQMRWLVFIVVAALSVLPLLGQVLTAAFGPDVGEVYGEAAFGLALASVPLGMGLAVLRYRLFDIDRVVSRTVSYALLTGVLVGIYALGVLGVGALVPGEPSDLLVAGSTLAVAALFRPLRSRIQALVDRRFNRSRYDAVRTAEAFGARLRDEVAVGTVVGDLTGVVAATIHPRHASVWLAEVQR